MAWKESWQLKARRHLRKAFNKLVHDDGYFISRYRGAAFLLGPHGIGTLEISAKIAEHPELTAFMSRCADLAPSAFIDIGANIGLYSCVLLRNGSAPRAILFEPDRLNLIQLKANLLINDLLDRAEVHEVALGDEPGPRHLVRGAIDGGLSRVVSGRAPGSYEIHVARLDDLLPMSGNRLAIKIDVEQYECRALAGMQNLLRKNACVVQIEALETREEVVAIMAAADYALVEDFAPNLVFSNVNHIK
jgi:FkbM family methyltransferase